MALNGTTTKASGALFAVGQPLRGASLPDPIDARGLMTDGGGGRFTLDPNAVIGIAIHHSVSGGQFFTNPALDQDDELSHLIMIDRYHASQGSAVIASGRSLSTLRPAPATPGSPGPPASSSHQHRRTI